MPLFHPAPSVAGLVQRNEEVDEAREEIFHRHVAPEAVERGKEEGVVVQEGE